jgi:Domain of unknown function (DUF4386)
VSAQDVARPLPAGAARIPSGRSPATLASSRLAGGLYVVVIVLGIFAEVVVRSSLVVSGDAEASAANIRDSEWLFRMGFAADLVVFLCDVALAVILYYLFRPVSRTVSLLAAAFRLTQTSIIGLNLLNMFGALLILRESEYSGAFGERETDALALFFLDLHSYGYVLGLTFFGVSTVLVGYLALRSGRMPRALGVLLGLAGLGYLVDGATFFLVPGYDGAISPVVLAPALVGEVWFALWLLFRGRRLEALSDALG